MVIILQLNSVRTLIWKAVLTVFDVWCLQRKAQTQDD